jgi:hypothetical protein
MTRNIGSHWIVSGANRLGTLMRSLQAPYFEADGPRPRTTSGSNATYLTKRSRR